MSTGVPFKVLTGRVFTTQDGLGIGTPVWDHADARIHRVGFGSGDVNPRYYPGVDKIGNLFMEYGTLIRTAHPDYRDHGFGFEGSDFVVRINGTAVLRLNLLGVAINGAVTQTSADTTYLPSRTGLAELLFPLFNDKTLLAQFNRPAFAGIDATGLFRAYRDAGQFLIDFNSVFSRGGTIDQAGLTRYVNKNYNYSFASANQPRIAYSMLTGKCRGCLFEAASVNLLIQSYTLSAWVSNFVTLTKESNIVWSTKGLNSPYSFIESNNNTEHSLYETFSAAPGQSVAASFYYQAKTFSGTRGFTFFVATPDRANGFGINLKALSGGAPAFVSNRVFGNGSVTSYEIESIRDGLYRIKIIGVVNSADTSTSATLSAVCASLGDTANNTSLVFTPSANTGNWCLIGDFQAEQSTVVSSYIQTALTTLSRNADKLTLNLANFRFTPLEGIFQFNFKNARVFPIGAVLFSLADAANVIHVDCIITSADTNNNLYTVGLNVYQADGSSTLISNVATSPIAPSSKLTVPYSNLPATLTQLIVDAARGFTGALSLISYE